MYSLLDIIISDIIISDKSMIGYQKGQLVEKAVMKKYCIRLKQEMVVRQLDFYCNCNRNEQINPFIKSACDKSVGEHY